MFTQESENIHCYNIKRHVDTEVLLKVTGSHVHCKSDNILETVQYSDIVTENTNRKSQVVN